MTLTTVSPCLSPNPNPNASHPSPLPSFESAFGSPSTEFPMQLPRTATPPHGQQSRSPSHATPPTLPSLQERLLQQRQEVPIFVDRPTIHTPVSLRGDQLSRSTASLSLSPKIEHPETLLSHSPSSRSESSSTFSSSSPRDFDVDGKRKRPRFLGDIDRRIIIQRLENGEKQADLAREFGVTRAAICHINKNREEILTRFDILAKSPQGRQMIENYVRSPHFSTSVREIRTPSVSVLLTRLGDTSVSPFAFKSTADRLMGILIEEALIGFGTKPIDVEDIMGLQYEGKEYERQPMALSVADEGRPLFESFAAMEPSAFRGFVHVDSSHHSKCRLELPANASEINVLVLQVALTDAETMSSIINALKANGVPPSRVCVVCVTATADAITNFASRHRDVRLVTAIIDADVEAPRLAGFPERYANALRRTC